MHNLPLQTDSPCISCGACCAAFRVSFYWAEADILGLPPALVEAVNPHFSCMAGTNAAVPRCQALQGEVGELVGCMVYASRPSPCHEVQVGDSQCNKARQRHALPALASLAER